MAVARLSGCHAWVWKALALAIDVRSWPAADIAERRKLACEDEQNSGRQSTPEAHHRWKRTQRSLLAQRGH